MKEDYWNYTNKDLNEVLGKFWFAAHNQKGDHYKVTSLKHIRYALKRILQRKNKIDILTHPNFSESQKLFKDACHELKKKGYGSIEHTEEIKPTGMYITN